MRCVFRSFHTINKSVLNPTAKWHFRNQKKKYIYIYNMQCFHKFAYRLAGNANYKRHGLSKSMRNISKGFLKCFHHLNRFNAFQKGSKAFPKGFQRVSKRFKPFQKGFQRVSKHFKRVSKEFQKGFQSVSKRFQRVSKAFPKGFKPSETRLPKGFRVTSNPLKCSHSRNVYLQRPSYTKKNVIDF